MKIMSDLREAMWGMVQVGVSKLDLITWAMRKSILKVMKQARVGVNITNWLREV